MTEAASASEAPEHSLRILVVRTGALGDTLMATPVVRALRARYPEAAIDFLCAELAAPLLELNPGIARVLRLRHRNLPWLLSPEKQRLAQQMRGAHYQFAVLLESAPRFRHLLERAGIRHVRSFRETPFDPAQHSIVNNLRAAGFADWQQAPASSLDMDLPLSPEDDRAAAKLLESVVLAGGGQARELAPTQLLVGLHAGYGPRSGKKNQGQRLRGWGAESFAILGRLLIERGACLVLTGSAADREEAEAIAAWLPAGSFLQLASRTTVRELAAVIRRLRLFVSVDSGPAHMAAAVGTPLVVIWGPGILEQTRPLSSTTPIRIVRHRVFCAPCYGTPMMKTCRRNICMESISPQRVLADCGLLIADFGLKPAPSSN